MTDEINFLENFNRQVKHFIDNGVHFAGPSMLNLKGRMRADIVTMQLS